MTPRTILIAGVFILAGCAHSNAAPSGDELLQSIAGRDALLHTIRFRVVWTTHVRADRGALLTEGSQALDVAMNEAGHYLISIVYTQKLPTMEKPTSIHITGTYNSDNARELRSHIGLKQSVAYIRPHPTIEWAIEPTQLPHVFKHSPALLLKTIPTQTGTPELINGVTAVPLTWELSDPNVSGGAKRGTYWIAPSLGNAVVCRQMDRRPKGGMEWKLMERITSNGFQQVADFWFPKTAAYEFYAYYPDGGYELKREVHATFENWKVNEVLAPETFRLSFPKGTEVWDLTKPQHSRYVVGDIDDARIAREVAAIHDSMVNPQELSDRLNDIEAGTRRAALAARMRLTLFIVSLIGIGAIIGTTYWVRRRSTRETE